MLPLFGSICKITWSQGTVSIWHSALAPIRLKYLNLSQLSRRYGHWVPDWDVRCTLGQWRCQEGCLHPRGPRMRPKGKLARVVDTASHCAARCFFWRRVVAYFGQQLWGWQCTPGFAPTLGPHPWQACSNYWWKIQFYKRIFLYQTHDLPVFSWI